MSSAHPPTAEPVGAPHLAPEGVRPLVWRTGSARPDHDRSVHGRVRPPWWVIGGWSIEAFAGVSRPHEDMDVSILSSDVEEFRLFLGDRYTPWNVDDSWFRPFDARFTDVRPDSQVWVRRDAQCPWILDVPFTPDTDGRWTNKRHLAHTEDVEDVPWVAPDGLRYARPEVTLMFKAAQVREKDRRDADVALARRDAGARRWLRDAVARFAPHHEWVQAL